MSVPAADLRDLARRYLERQGWYARATADEAGPLELLEVEELSDGQPGLARLVLAKGQRRLQLFVGWRRASTLGLALRNEEAALLGAAEDAGTPVVLYEALADDECCRLLLSVATDGREEALRVRHVGSLVSHASLVFDERLFMKCYRVLEPGDRPEVEALFGLDRVGFNALIAPVARWRVGGYDLALVREFLPSALEGRQLALTSLRDLLAYVHEAGAEPLHDIEAGMDPAGVAGSSGGDVAPEIRRLGQTTARLHLALERAFGIESLAPRALADSLEREATEEGAALVARIELAEPGELGAAIRLHGDYHLRRVMRSDVGWLVSGFSDDPLYASGSPIGSLAARRGSPLEDVADMCFALGEVAGAALALRPAAEQDLAAPLAQAWVERNREAFLRGYASEGPIEHLLPPAGSLRDQLLELFVSVRERRYEARSAR